MNPMGWIDRAATIAITAAVTSGVWYAAGIGLFDLKRGSALPPARPVATEMAQLPAGAENGTGPLDQDAALRRPDLPVDGDLIVPVQGVAASSLRDTFYDARGAGDRSHEAIDIMAPRGTIVVAAAGGTLEKLYRSKAGGLTIYLRSADRETLYYYAHLDSYAPDLREGQVVPVGTTLGTVGSSGNASEDAPHLHFAIMRTTADADWWEPATPINPYPLLRAAPAMRPRSSLPDPDAADPA